MAYFSTIVVDTREKKPLPFKGYKTIRRKLDYGDYSLIGLERQIVVERKSIVDFFGTLSSAAARARFGRELEGAALDGTRVCIVVEATPGQIARGVRWTNASGKAILSMAFGMSLRWNHGLVMAGSRSEAEMVVLAILKGWLEAARSGR